MYNIQILGLNIEKYEQEYLRLIDDLEFDYNVEKRIAEHYYIYGADHHNRKYIEFSLYEKWENHPADLECYGACGKKGILDIKFIETLPQSFALEYCPIESMTIGIPEKIINKTQNEYECEIFSYSCEGKKLYSGLPWGYVKIDKTKFCEVKFRKYKSAKK